MFEEANSFWLLFQNSRCNGSRRQFSVPEWSTSYWQNCTMSACHFRRVSTSKNVQNRRTFSSVNAIIMTTTNPPFLSFFLWVTFIGVWGSIEYEVLFLLILKTPVFHLILQSRTVGIRYTIAVYFTIVFCIASYFLSYDHLQLSKFWISFNNRVNATIAFCICFLFF